jgi:hypothetical protein
MVVGMKEHNETPEPDFDAWEPLRAATARYLNSNSIHVKQICDAVAAAALSGPHEQKNEQRDGKSRRGDGEKQRDEAQREYVEQRLKEIAEFERGARGLIVRQRRRC